jgi:hypothetical protein
MSHLKISFTIYLTICSIGASALTLDELDSAYQAQILRVSQEKEKSLDQLRRSYLKSLGRIEIEFQKAGRLEDVLLVRKQIELVESKVWPFPRQGEGDPTQLVAGRKLYDKAHIDRVRVSSEKRVEAGKTMGNALEEQIVNLTKAGDIDQATEAKKLLEETEVDQSLRDAMDFLARAGRNSSGPPACRIRRFGDGIEVMVRYDKSGKISLESPIENVIEITGGKRERGSTKAKVLGEFVGSKGYEPDPWIVFQNDLDENYEGLAFTSFSKQLNVKADDGESGLEIKLIPNPVNPHIALSNPHVLPPLQDAGTYQITCSYYLPKDNKGITGFSWYQGPALIKKFIFDKEGTWTTKTVESDSINEVHQLRLYAKFKAGTAPPAAAGDSIFLKKLQVKQTTFSTYIISKYDKYGELTESFPDSTTQKKLTLAGVLVSP